MPAVHLVPVRPELNLGLTSTPRRRPKRRDSALSRQRSQSYGGNGKGNGNGKVDGTGNNALAAETSARVFKTLSEPVKPDHMHNGPSPALPHRRMAFVAARRGQGLFLFWRSMIRNTLQYVTNFRRYACCCAGNNKCAREGGQPWPGKDIHFACTAQIDLSVCADRKIVILYVYLRKVSAYLCIF